jgi:hypothetical protein
VSTSRVKSKSIKRTGIKTVVGGIGKNEGCPFVLTSYPPILLASAFYHQKDTANKNPFDDL